MAHFSDLAVRLSARITSKPSKTPSKVPQEIASGYELVREPVESRETIETIINLAITPLQSMEFLVAGCFFFFLSCANDWNLQVSFINTLLGKDCHVFFLLSLLSLHLPSKLWGLPRVCPTIYWLDGAHDYQRETLNSPNLDFLWLHFCTLVHQAKKNWFGKLGKWARPLFRLRFSWRWETE